MDGLRRAAPICAGLALLSMARVCWGAVPDLRHGRQAGPLRVFPDDRRANLFYYPPGDLALVTDASGKPEFQFLQLRHTGTGIEADADLRRTRNIIAMRIAHTVPTAAELRAVRSALGPRPVELRPLPIARLEAVVVYTPAGGSTAGADSAMTLPAGHFEADQSSGLSTATGFWTERVFSLRLDDPTAQLFDVALRQGLLVLSLGYAFVAAGIAADQPIAELSGSPAVVDALRERAGLAVDSAAIDSSRIRQATAGHLVRAGALAIHVDIARWPDLVRQIDLNEQLPPGYPVLLAYCYDFRDALNDTLYAKLLEVEADGVAGRPVLMTVLFSRTQPDLYAQAVRFPFAVQLDRPFRYRVVEVTREGSEHTSHWVERASWSGILDLTTLAPVDSAPSVPPAP